MAGLVPGAVCLLLTPALLYVLYPPEVKDTPDAPAKVCWVHLVPSAVWAALLSAACPVLALRIGERSTVCISCFTQAKEELAKLGPMSTDEKLTAFAFAVTVGLW